MTDDEKQEAALQDIARVRAAVEKLRGLFAAAVAADLASAPRARDRHRPTGPPRAARAPASEHRPPGR